MKNVYRIISCVIVISSFHISCSSHEKKAINKKTINFYELLPQVNTQTADLFFIPSRSTDGISLDEGLLEMLAGKFSQYAFIETGTYLGNTTEKAASRFSSVHTIELSDTLFQRAQERFKNNPTVHLYHGDSIEILPRISNALEGNALFFLDAHYSPLEHVAQGPVNTPILTEIEELRDSILNNCILVIDDIRYFYEPLINVSNTFMAGYPLLTEVIEKIWRINNNICCAIISDVLLVYPKELNIKVSPLIYATTMSRLYDGSNFNSQDVIYAEFGIATATNKAEIKGLKYLVEQCTDPLGYFPGFSRHYPLWYGLFCLKNNEFEAAYKLFHEAKKRGLNHWRIDWYMLLAETHSTLNMR